MNYTNNFWSDYFKYYDILLEVIPYKELFNSIVSNLDLYEGAKVLDLGSGTGNFQYFKNCDIDLVCMDNSKEALSRLKLKFPNSETLIHSIEEKLPFEDNSFDRIVSNNVLYTIERSKWPFVISEIRRVLKPNGTIVVSNLNQNFKAITIYKDHISKSIKAKGIGKTVLDLVKLIYPTIKMINFNNVINKQDRIGEYSFLKLNEQKRKFVDHGFESKCPTIDVYSNQAYLDVLLNKK